MLYCKKCKREVEENETEIGGKIGEAEQWPGDGINPGPSQKMLFRVRQREVCGGEVVDQDSVERVKKVLHPDA